MKKILSVALLLLAVDLSAYEKVEFKGQMSDPGLIKVSAVTTSAGQVAVADAKTGSISIFDVSGKLFKKSTASLKEPAAICSGGNRLYAADTGNSRIAVFDMSGAPLWTFSGPGSMPGQLNKPLGIAYGPDGRIYVANTGNSRIEVFNADGIFLYGFPVARNNGALKVKPAKIALDNAGNVYISDPDNSAILKYDRTGGFVDSYAFANDGVAVDAYGVLYVINGKEGKVREISASGEVLGTFGTRGKGKSEFLKLVDITVDEKGVLYLADEGNKKVAAIALESEKPAAKLERAGPLDRFDLKGPVKKYQYKADMFVVRADQSLLAHLPDTKSVAVITDAGAKPLMAYGALQGQVKSPRGMTVTGDGKVFVCDSGNDRVQIFGADGAFLDQFGEKGAGEGKFSWPSGVAVNSKGIVYVADTKNKRVQAFNADGIFLFAVGPQIDNVSLMQPVAVRTDAERNLYILDAMLKKVVVTNANGKFLTTWDYAGFQDPSAMDYDGRNNFYILDRGDYSVKVFDRQGKFVTSFFAKGSGERELAGPQYMAVAGNKLFLADTAGGKIEAFDIAYAMPAPGGVKVLADESKVQLSWQALKDPWLKAYAVFRSEEENGKYEKIAMSDKAEYSDIGLAAGTTYFYFVAGVSMSGDAGDTGKIMPIYFNGPAVKPAAAQSETPVVKEEAKPEVQIEEPVKAGITAPAEVKTEAVKPAAEEKAPAAAAPADIKKEEPVPAKSEPAVDKPEEVKKTEVPAAPAPTEAAPSAPTT